MKSAPTRRQATARREQTRNGERLRNWLTSRERHQRADRTQAPTDQPGDVRGPAVDYIHRHYTSGVLIPYTNPDRDQNLSKRARRRNHRGRRPQ